ncbi:ankyrin repeat domain-containing protein [Bremerella sp. JC817]|uniref:ankyrin repeat domain-containing protein n=1 Tax=Bremerella sp. JC817 TaxID=3231756 RepID=UPI0034579375
MVRGQAIATRNMLVMLALLLSVPAAGYLYAHRSDTVQYAIRHGDMVLLKQLVRSHEDATQRLRVPGPEENWGEPIHLAAAARHPEVVQYLLELGADPNAQTDDGMTPLFYCHSTEKLLVNDPANRAFPNHAVLVQEVLLAAGANIDHRYNGITPLMWAVKNCDLPVVRSLLDHNAAMNLIDYNARTALDHANEIKPTVTRHLLVTMLTEHGAISAQAATTN